MMNNNIPPKVEVFYMSDNITSEEYRAEIAALHHEIYELRTQLNEERVANRPKIDKNNPFNNPTDYPVYSGDYSDIIPQIETECCELPLEPNKSEKKRLRHFYSIGGTCILSHFIFTSVAATLLMMAAMTILQLRNPAVSYTTLYEYAVQSSIIIAISAIVYIIANVGLSFAGLKWSGIKAHTLIDTRNFGFGKAIQYCLAALFIQYGAGLLSTGIADILGQYGFDASTTGSEDMAKTSLGMLVLVLYQCILAPITEELFFRGMLLKVFSRANQRFAIVITAVFFGLAHGNLPQFCLAFLLGIFMAHIVVKHNSILPSIIVHIFINTVAMILSTMYDYFSENSVQIAAASMVYMLLAVAGLVMLIEFIFKNKIPATTPHQSRRGFAVAKTSFPLILAFATELIYMAFNIFITKYSASL
jgi:hypothetical protein